MRRLHPSLWYGLVLLPLVLAAGCGPEEEADEVLTEEEALDGLSREQIRQQAEAMSPEQAEQLGIVDTTIRVENPINPLDSALISDTIRLGPTPGTTP